MARQDGVRRLSVTSLILPRHREWWLPQRGVSGGEGEVAKLQSWAGGRAPGDSRVRLESGQLADAGASYLRVKKEVGPTGEAEGKDDELIWVTLNLRAGNHPGEGSLAGWMSWSGPRDGRGGVICITGGCRVSSPWA